jgi:TolA-binding protein
VLFGGVGALLFLALGERNAASKVADAPATAGVPRSASAAPGAELEPRKGSGDAVGEPAQPVEPAGSDKPSDADERPVRRAPPRTQNRRPPPAQTAAVTQEPEQRATSTLAKQAESLEKQGKWNEARVAYQKLEKAKGANALDARYHQAWSAFQSSDVSDAAALAKSVADAAGDGPLKQKSRLLYADALFRQGQFARAKIVYLNARKEMPPGDERSNTVRKIAKCNFELKLAESDGLDK